ncbi:PadR family transcriptional regulator [Saccharothrix syringae]|uniref:PadR family transcriptional regulator n=1 Tax=Saccharothrix syringae TaxID=103733 RepID=A0A5Q0GZL4_SACSY|nr:PadR family transcriptional regulator [Saccharothrix syringae]QFZ19105.1 PadR family transcriptional regulator [Saccharothrix syringae]
MGNGLGRLELVVLTAVARLDEDAYGLSVRREVERLSGRDYSVGAVYTTLSRLEGKGLVDTWTTEPLPTRGGRSRRMYRINTAGRQAVRDARTLAARLWRPEPGGSFA